MKTKKSLQVITALLLVSVMVLSGVEAARAQTPVNEGEPSAAKTSAAVELNLNIPYNLNTVDPALATDTPDFEIIEQLFIGLMDWDDETAEVKPELAASWVFSDNFRVVDFTLRNDVYWSDGHKVTAYDVEYGILRSLTPATHSSYAYILYPILNAYDYYTGMISNPDQVGVKALSETHLRVTLAEPGSQILSALASPVARPQPAWAIAAWGDQWTQPAHIVTNGAYRLVEVVEDDHVLLEKNLTYYDAANVQIEKINIAIVDGDTAWMMYGNGTLDLVNVPPAAQPNAYTAQEIVRRPNACTYYYGFNSTLPPFDNPLVRKAFIAATNRNDITSFIYASEPALTFTPKGVFGYVDGVNEDVGIPYDPAQARAWLAQAGYPNGLGLPEVTLSINSSLGHARIAEFVRDSWLQVLGVNVNIEQIVWQDYLQQLHSGAYQVWRLGWCLDYPDADNFLSEALGSAAVAFGNWNNPLYWQQIDQAAQTDNQALRKIILKQRKKFW